MKNWIRSYAVYGERACANVFVYVCVWNKLTIEIKCSERGQNKRIHPINPIHNKEFPISVYALQSMLFIWLSIQRISTLYSPCITHTIRHRQPRRKTSKNYTKPNINGAEVAVAKSIKTVSIFTHEGNFFVSSREKKKKTKSKYVQSYYIGNSKWIWYYNQTYCIWKILLNV